LDVVPLFPELEDLLPSFSYAPPTAIVPAPKKRTAFAATYTLLAINGARLTADARRTQDFMPALSMRSQFTFDKLEPLLRKHVVFDK
jgi:hypothetical protein